jgi:hypothetical protein
MQGRDEKCIQNLSKTQKGRVHFEDLGIDNIEIDPKDIGSDGVYWIDLSQDRD